MCRSMDSDNPQNNCVLGFHQLEVEQPKFNNKVLLFVTSRTGSCAHMHTHKQFFFRSSGQLEVFLKILSFS